MNRSNEFSLSIKQQALTRQKFRCASCGTKIYQLGNEGAFNHKFGESAHAHHITHIKFGGNNGLLNCVIICQSCHYSAHEGGNYRYGTAVATQNDFPHYYG